MSFQPKAWYDEGKCEDYARKEVKEITAEAKAAGRESVVIFDNLSGQTTERHRRNLAKHKCKRHLLPGGMTDELQLVDDGIGFALKNMMGKLHDDWLMKPGNLELWTAEGGGFPMWKKRVLITNLAAEAWENVCARFNFEGAAQRIGMRMTIDGTGDNFIRIQGIENYSFTDADGGPPGAESDEEGVEPEEEEELDEDIEDDGEEDGSEVDDDDDDEVEGGDAVDSSDDDTALEGTVATYIGNASAPDGYKIIDDCLPLETREEMNMLVGKLVLIGHDSQQARGWFVGRVHSLALSAADLRKTPTANVVIKYDRKLTGKKLHGLEAREISASLHGPAAWWVEVEEV